MTLELSPAILSVRCRKAIRCIACFTVVFLLHVSGTVRGAEPMRYVHHPPESPTDKRYLYHWKILETALQRTEATWGPYVIEVSDAMPEKRQAFELKSSGKLTVMYLGTTQEMERELIPIRIPVDKNLGGYCVFLIHRRNQNEFQSALFAPSTVAG